MSSVPFHAEGTSALYVDPSGAVPVTHVTVVFVQVGAAAAAGVANATITDCEPDHPHLPLSPAHGSSSFAAPSVKRLSSCLIFGCLRSWRARCYGPARATADSRRPAHLLRDRAPGPRAPAGDRRSGRAARADRAPVHGVVDPPRPRG